MTEKMTELVRRADVQDEIDRWLDSVGTVLVGKGLSYYGELIGCLEDAPAADVAPVRHGRWIKYPRAHYFKCSECKCVAPYKKAMAMDGERKYKYCPGCGAKMDKEAEI